MSDKTLVLELYPRAACSRFPVAQPTASATRFIIKLSPGSPRFAAGNTAAQAWRRAYENIIADAPKEKRVSDKQYTAEPKEDGYVLVHMPGNGYYLAPDDALKLLMSLSVAIREAETQNAVTAAGTRAAEVKE